ncbi:MAG: DNA polymerase III subunit beta, partial [Patescibacteria group bacterium]
ETTTTIFIGAKILKDGSFTLPARTFTELINTLPAGKITLELSEGQLLVSTDKFNSKINGIPAVEWPISETEVLDAKKDKVEISASDFVSAVNQTAFAAATDDGRPALTGVLFLPEEDKLTLVSTDGFRLSQKTLVTKITGKSVLVPAKALIEAARIIGEETKKEAGSLIFLSFIKNQIIFFIGDIILSSRLIEGTFPAYEKIIPSTTSSLSVSLSSAELLRAIRSAGIFARDNANIIKFQISDNKFQISSVAAQIGENVSELDAKIDGGTKEKFTIAFNYRYLLDFLSIIGDDEVVIEFSTPLSPGLFKIPALKNFLHLIMPVRVQN